MRKLTTLAVMGSLLLAVVVPEASAHNVWCHCPKGNKLTTLKFFYKAGEVYEALSDAMRTWHTANSPLEKGEFAKVMLSGRNAFGDKMPQLTDMISCYERMYVQTCMSTISATMQVYPKGFEWLK